VWGKLRDGLSERIGSYPPIFIAAIGAMDVVSVRGIKTLSYKGLCAAYRLVGAV
jgi:hypothetical protein